MSIDPAMLPNVLLSNGTCQPFYPHSYPRINNIFTVRSLAAKQICVHRDLVCWEGLQPFGVL